MDYERIRQQCRTGRVFLQLLTCALVLLYVLDLLIPHVPTHKHMSTKDGNHSLEAGIFDNSSATSRGSTTGVVPTGSRLTNHGQNYGSITENTQKEPQGDKKCERKVDLVYIKTHKTGSCTTTNMLYRNVLSHNIDTLLFSYFPFPRNNNSRFYLHKHSWIWTDHDQPVPSKFHLAAEHMRYERNDFDKVMLGTPLYTTTLRRPLDHLRSMFNYFGLAKRLGMEKSHVDPAEEFIRNYEKYSKRKLDSVYRLDNRNANMFGFPEEYMNNLEEIERFIQKMTDEFGLVMITEYMAESYVLLRRKMCWDLGDILYSSINVRKYKYKTEPDPELVQLHMAFNKVDYMLYDHFNNTLWTQINQEGTDFWDEIDVYEKYQIMSADYCELVYKEMKRNMSSIYHLHRTMKPLVLPETKWGPETIIDPVWCLVSRIDIMPFYNILRVKQIPQICDHQIPFEKPDRMNMYYFRINDQKKKIQMMPQYCAKNPDNLMASLDLLATKGMYMWS